MSTPDDYGGMDLPAITRALVWTELGRTRDARLIISRDLLRGYTKIGLD